MAAESVYVQITWEDSETGNSEQPLLGPPVAIGRDADSLPSEIDGQAVSHLALDHRQISRFHALITVANHQLYITDQSSNGTFLNGQRIHQTRHAFSSRDTVRIGPYKITAKLMRDDHVSATELTHHTEHSRYVGPSAQKPLSKNKMAIWLIGLGILVVMGTGAWAVMSSLLERARPRTPETPTSIQRLHPSALLGESPQTEGKAIQAS